MGVGAVCCGNNQTPVVLLMGPGQGVDSLMFENLMEALWVKKAGPRRPRSRPDRAMADKVHSAKALRACLRGRGMPHPRPVSCDKEAYKRRNVVEPCQTTP